MDLLFIIILLVLGLGLLVIEVIMLPGLITGIIGFAMCVSGILWMYNAYGTNAGNIALISTLISSVIIGVIIFKSGAWNRLSLHDTLSGKTLSVESLNLQIGQEGLSLSALRPSGSVMINNEKVEATSLGEFIDANQSIEVVKIAHQKIFVKRKTL
ncbi:MAG TPA: NfeD family protein [Bacteroidia bacterium]|nr:NfeD family protein [Bacteroidia bacterium]HNT81043.1 NfeD family protein [Bacteroidia bacterium]